MIEKAASPDSHLIVPVEKEYEYVSAQVRFHMDKIFDAFKMFIQVFSAIVGGAIWLSLQEAIRPRTHMYVVLSDWLVILLAVVSCAIVAENWRAWRSNRHAQSRLGGKDESGT